MHRYAGAIGQVRVAEGPKPGGPRPYRTLAMGALLFALGLVMSLLPAQAADDGALLVARLQQIADAYVAERAGPEHITGVALQVSLGERSPAIVVSSGTDSRSPAPQPMDEDTLFQTGSNTKASPPP